LLEIDARKLMGSKAPMESIRIGALTFDPAGERLAVGIGNYIAVVDLSDGQRTGEHHVASHSGLIMQLVFTYTGHLVAEHFDMKFDGSQSLHIFGRDGSCFTLEPKRHSEFDGHIGFWAVSPSGAKLVLAMSGADGLWDLGTQKRAGLGPLFDAIEKYKDNMPRGEGPVALTADGSLLAIWMVAPSDTRYIDYGDQLIIANLETGECNMLKLHDPQWFTTQVDRANSAPGEAWGGETMR
jgi:hypothetical protein